MVVGVASSSQATDTLTRPLLTYSNPPYFTVGFGGRVGFHYRLWLPLEIAIIIFTILLQFWYLAQRYMKTRVASTRRITAGGFDVTDASNWYGCLERKAHISETYGCHNVPLDTLYVLCLARA